jgi:hypothetical protein
MGFWNKLGKAALIAAPYVAAPFTGGTSLLLTGAANAAEHKWAQHDAEKAIAEGKEPSKFDRYLGLGANVAGVASGIGALGSLGGTAGSLAGSLGNAASTGTRIANIGNLANAGMGIAGEAKNIASSGSGSGIGPSGTSNTTNKGMDNGIGPSSTTLSGVMPKGGYNYDQNPMNQLNQSNPNLASSIFQGRQEAIRNQPFRAGYDVNHLASDGKTAYVSRMPSIFSTNDNNANYGSEKSSPYSDTSGGLTEDQLNDKRVAKARPPINKRARV